MKEINTTKLNLNTKDETLTEILGNGKFYFVPKFQRDYSWRAENWEDLWEDLDFAYQNNDFHYMGYLVLQESEERNFIIIDGQQRFTTFSLFFLAAIQRFKNLNDNERAEEILNRYIGSKDLKYLRLKLKLKLNRNNSFYYREATGGAAIPKINVNPTVILMSKAFDYFLKKFEEIDKKELASFLENIANKTLFTTIYVGDGISAYKIFETLNARGVKLSATDLLKNYLFSQIDSDQDTPDEVLDELDENWGNIGINIAPKSYVDFALTEWNSRHKLVRANNLFKSIKTEVLDKERSSYYLKLLKEASPKYAALFKPYDELWDNFPEPDKIRMNLEFLKTYNIKQPFSLLLYYLLNFREQFPKILNWIKILSLRYNVICNLPPNEQERLYSSICANTENNKNLNFIKEQLLSLYPTDEKFKAAFKDKILPTSKSSKRARYLLVRIEEHLSKNKIDDNNFTLEHILPAKPNESWQGYFENWLQFNQRLGNFALLKVKTNKDDDQKPFSQKKETLLKSDYKINKIIIENCQEWNPNSIENRQEQLAKFACQVWKID